MHMGIQFAFLSDWHVIVLLFVVILLFGGKKLPEVARGLGEAMREFKKASRDLQDDSSVKSSPPPSTPPTASAQHNSEPKQG